MKKIIQIFIFSISLSMFSPLVQAQNSVQKIDTTQFRVEGVCDMCKSRIENATLVKGVKFVEWDTQSRIITVIYRTDKVTEADIYKAVVESGHDTESLKATEQDYDKLPDCCAYRDGVETH